MKKKIIITGIILALLGSVYLIIGNYFYNFALNAKQEKTFLEENPHLVKANSEGNSLQATEELMDKTFSSQSQNNVIRITSYDNLKLTGYEYINGMDEHKWAIVVHGYGGKAADMTTHIRHFYERGYNVIAPDLRGHGKSEGDYIGMGWHDRKDILLWIQQIIEKDPKAEIVLLGVSMGGATVMMTSGEKLPQNVKVIIEDCGFSSAEEQLTYQLKDLFHLPKFPVINAANTITKVRAGFDLKEASAVKQVKKSKTPMLFIHGDNDTFVPLHMLDEVYDAAKVDKEKVIISGAGHAESAQVDSKNYWNSVWKFVEKYIPA